MEGRFNRFAGWKMNEMMNLLLITSFFTCTQFGFFFTVAHFYSLRGEKKNLEAKTVRRLGVNSGDLRFYVKGEKFEENVEKEDLEKETRRNYKHGW